MEEQADSELKDDDWGGQVSFLEGPTPAAAAGNGTSVPDTDTDAFEDVVAADELAQ